MNVYVVTDYWLMWSHCVLQDCVIAECGEMGPDEPLTQDNEGLGDVYPGFPADASDLDFTDVRPKLPILSFILDKVIALLTRIFGFFQRATIEEVAITIKNAGTHYFKQQEFSKAKRKYSKAQRYDWLHLGICTSAL